MPLSEFHQSIVDQFFGDIALFQPAYRHSYLRYLAVRSKDKWLLLHAVMVLSTLRPDAPDPFETTDICAGVVPLRDIGSSPQEILKQVLAEGVELAGKLITFPPEHGGSHSAQAWSFDAEQYNPDAAGGARISGSNNSHLMHEPATIRQLKIAHPSFYSVSDLAKFFGMTFDAGSSSHIELRASSIARVDAAHIEHGRAKIRFHVSPPLAAAGAKLSIRATTENNEQNSSSPTITWEAGPEGGQIGVVDVPLPNARSALCILSYGGFVQERVVVKEPPHFHNTLLFVHQIFDPEDKGFARAINERKLTDRESSPYESTVAALLSLSGFRVIAIDRVPHLNGIPDIVAADRRENLLIVECTLDLPHSDNKLSKLANRHRAIREKLDEAGLTHVQTLALLAVALPCRELAPFYRDADKAGVNLWGREDLHALRESKGARAAEDIFDELAAQCSLTFEDVNEAPEYF